MSRVIDTGNPELDSILAGIADQMLRNQWLNVCNRVHDLMGLALHRFSQALRGV